MIKEIVLVRRDGNKIVQTGEEDGPQHYEIRTDPGNEVVSSHGTAHEAKDALEDLLKPPPRRRSPPFRP